MENNSRKRVFLNQHCHRLRLSLNLFLCLLIVYDLVVGRAHCDDQGKSIVFYQSLRQHNAHGDISTAGGDVRGDCSVLK